MIRPRRGSSRNRLRLAVAMACVAAAAAFSCTRRVPDDEASSSGPVILRVGVAGASATNPATGLRQLSQNLSVEPLLRPGPDGRLQALVADNWTAADNGRSVTMRLRRQVKFHDGTPLDPTAVVAVLPDAMRSLMGPVYDDVEDIAAVPPDSVAVRFRRPSPFLLEALEAQIRKPGPTVVGTGPYAIAEGTTTELRRNNDYYLGRPVIDRIVLSNHQTVRSAWAELLRDRLDMLYEVGGDALDSLEASSNISTFTVTRNYQYVVLLNVQAQALRARDTRRALNLAVDRRVFIKDALNDHGVASQGPLSPRYWALPRDAPAIGYNPGEAARLLGGASARKGERLRFTCLVPPGAVNERIALALKRQLQMAGVDMTVEQSQQDQIFQRMAKRDYDAVLIEGISAPTLLRAYYFWHSNTPFNTGGWGSSAVDSALDRARQAASDSEYTQAVGALQRTFVDDPPAIFLAWSVMSRAVSKRFVVPDPEPGRDVLATLRLWKPATGDIRASRN